MRRIFRKCRQTRRTPLFHVKNWHLQQIWQKNQQIYRLPSKKTHPYFKVIFGWKKCVVRLVRRNYGIFVSSDGKLYICLLAPGRRPLGTVHFILRHTTGDQAMSFTQHLPGWEGTPLNLEVTGSNGPQSGWTRTAGLMASVSPWRPVSNVPNISAPNGMRSISQDKQ